MGRGRISNGGWVSCKIDKMEGGFSKVLLMTTEGGTEVIAKIPCPNAGRTTYSTGSEAAVLEYGIMSLLIQITIQN